MNLRVESVEGTLYCTECGELDNDPTISRYSAVINHLLDSHRAEVLAGEVEIVRYR